MLKYCIMAFISGYSGNKLFGKDKGNTRSIKIASVIATILIVIKLIILKMPSN